MIVVFQSFLTFRHIANNNILTCALIDQTNWHRDPSAVTILLVCTVGRRQPDSLQLGHFEILLSSFLQSFAATDLNPLFA